MSSALAPLLVALFIVAKAFFNVDDTGALPVVLLGAVLSI
jgi:hypothetical protein